MDNVVDNLDLSGHKLKKLTKPTPKESQAVTVILDDNELQRLDNLDSFIRVQKLSAVRNQLLRMYGVCRLHNLQTLNLAHNGILTIEGLKDLTSLKCLCLAGNTIKSIEHLNTNINLVHLDLSDNNITHVTDISFLRHLKELLLHDNKIGHLRLCERYLPTSLVTLTLASNNISDLNEVSQLVHLTNLNSISIANNPCVNMTDISMSFDYRPFIINWCLNVRTIDGYVVDAIESLRAEWLYSQGRGRHFRVGDQQELSQYLASVCPLSGQNLETEEERKLRLILSKAQHHQQQLRAQESNPDSLNPSPVTRKKLHGVKGSPRFNASRLSNKSTTPDPMSSSCYTPRSNVNSPLMTQSLDPSVLNQTIVMNMELKEQQNGIAEKSLEDISSPLYALSKLVPVPESLMSPDYRPSPLLTKSITQSLAVSSSNSCRSSSAKSTPITRSPKPTRIASCKSRTAESPEKKSSAASTPRKKVPNSKPDNKEKADSASSTITLPSALKKAPSSDDESDMCASKLQTIRMKAEERKLQRDVEAVSTSSGEGKVEQAAICIQKMWRGYHVRNKNRNVQELFKLLQSQRADEYLKKLTSDMESTKVALESERRIQVLQMQAINALWKKVSSMQTGQDNATTASTNGVANVSTGKNGADLANLAETCNLMHNQIQQLQGSMQQIVEVISVITQIPSVTKQFQDNAIATQTEISAVHTPQGEACKLFPFVKQTRPSSLALSISQQDRQDLSTAVQNEELRQFAGTLVDDVIKTVSESDSESFADRVATSSLSEEQDQTSVRES